MTIVDAYSLPAVPWKNGGGLTRNLAIWPPDAQFDDFSWRVSVAEVQRSGGFSLFPGVDRTIILLSGGMILTGKNGPPHPLTAPFQPYSMPGEDSITARLLNGESRDLNVMVRRSAARASVKVWDRDDELAHDAETAVFFCARGAFQVVRTDCEAAVLLAGSAVTLRGVHAGLRMISLAADSVLIGALLDLKESE